MRYLLSVFCLLTLACVLPSCLFANHIAGSEVYYKFLRKLPNGNNQYQVTILDYYDCAQLNNPNPNKTEQDNDIAVYVFNNDNMARHSRFTVKQDPNFPPTKVEPRLLIQCAKINYEHCIELLTFNFEIDFPENDKGVTVVWQRCCRNSIAVNIVSPLDVGNTFMCTLPGRETDAIGNNAATPNRQSFMVICAEFDFEYDMSSYDADGDSLSYELVPAFNSTNFEGVGPNPGASKTDILGVISGPPPYQRVQYTSGYTYDQPFGANSRTYLNPQTGRLSVFARNEGWHIVVIKINEYRNGKLINETYRDFQVFVSARCVPIDIMGMVQKVSLHECPGDDHFLGLEYKTDMEYRWADGYRTAFRPVPVTEGTTNYIRRAYTPYNPVCPVWSDTFSLTFNKETTYSIIKAGEKKEICQGDSLWVGKARPCIGCSYDWSPTEGLANPKAGQTLASPTAFTSYVRTTYLNNKCEMYSDTVHVKVLDRSSQPCPTVSRTDLDGSNVSFTLYPNPAGNYVNVSYHLNRERGAVLEVYSAIGAKLNAYPLNDLSGVIEMDTRTWADGVYLLKIRSGDQTQMHKLVITR